MKVPGRHIGKDGIWLDKENSIVVATTDPIAKMNKKVKTSCGPGKRYATSSHPNTVEIFTDW